ncbi:RNA-directed DNA polymerase (reverse transcriptase)-related family protein [Rhynchospora pubera]|uniref:RNA-directed DNA polymerase (Reverse transcriptase)-related family protein n=1 Tax=Rhynchospora pubera TaxID=906938 RepID=A0AAV8FQW9_9POAL|nr:RNA-directed DNA polymerase (reverse transcriptase)-related family protein [Rhynchospora pubera]
MPKYNGGLGIPNLRTHNEALLAKWIWVLGTKPDSVWSTTVFDLFGTRDHNLLHSNSSISTILADLLKTKAIFQPMVGSHGLRPTIAWNWTSDQQFTVASAYKIMAWTGVFCPYHKQLWKLKAPPKVTLFLWLLLRDKLLTQHNLAKRGWPTIQACKLCQLQEIETADHLFVSCPFAKEILTRMTAYFNVTLHSSNSHVLNVWQTTRQNLPNQQREMWSTLWAATCWTIWKHRCSVVFDNKRPSLRQVFTDIQSNTRLWILS